MDTRRPFALAFRKIRKAKSLTQEDFSAVSSRTYVSTLERGMKSPTLEKIGELAGAMDVHPMTLLTLTFMQAADEGSLEQLQERVRQELMGIDRK